MNEEIHLRIWGQAHTELYQSLQNILPLKDHSILLFCDYSKYDIPYETIFNKIETVEGVVVYEQPFQLVFVTQQWLKKFDNIPRGWKTICLFKFNGVPPSVISNLPKLNDWMPTDERLTFKT